VVDRAVEVMSDRLNSPDCRFVCRVDPDLPSLFADRDALVTVLANLIENAYRYSGDEKEIQLQVYSSGGDVRFEVSDNGVGLSPKDQRKVFERFYQADRTLTGHRQGCGLGLNIVKHIVDAHGGEIEVVSSVEGGSKFTVVLPVDEAERSTIEAKTSCEATPC
jgi:two-component system phosphate regulon sensor histidine kinase PhoR